MAAQAKILRVLKLIALLKSRSKTVKELASILSTTERSIYRYLELLEEVGFLVDKDFNNRYFIHLKAHEHEDEFAFTSEESVLLKELINSGAGKHPLKQSLLKKLYLHSDQETLSNNILNARITLWLEKVGHAISLERQILLKDYHSAHSNAVNDRLVEAISISDDYQTLIAFDTGDGKSKHFKLDRIGEILILNKRMKFKSRHARHGTDIFGMGGSKIIWVELKMALRAYVLMREEFPKSVPYLSKEGRKYKFHGQVLSFEGIGRFVMGLADSIIIIKPQAFKTYVREKIASSGLG